MEPEIEKLITGLPDAAAARRFLDSFEEKHPTEHAKLVNNVALLSDVATLAAFSPLLATTMLQNPEYLWWLNKRRAESGGRSSEELLESLENFFAENADIEPQVVFARFRRRELLRIYLRDIRRLATIAEITEEISNLADAILESALQIARQETDARFGTPNGSDGESVRFCIVALGKLGSRELNYSSDIDLLFLYSEEGTTTGGSRDKVTNREYFVKLAEHVRRLVGQQSGEAAYRVDLRLRPHGSLGALTLSVNDTIRYYKNEARGWERQVMIRSRGCAGDVDLFKEYFAAIESLVFSENETVEAALTNVRRSKERMDLENTNRRGFNVKLGSGGVREIEFLAQALQLAYGGKDKWLRSPHTLISIARLTDRGHFKKAELTQLSSAYEFLRRTEHILQMENGVQTHTVPDEAEKRALIAHRVTFAAGGNFERELKDHTKNVSRIFARVFGDAAVSEPGAIATGLLFESEEKNPVATASGCDSYFATIAPHFAAMLATSLRLAGDVAESDAEFVEPDYATIMKDAVTSEGETSLRPRLAAIRQTWSRQLLDIVVHDVHETITIRDAKRLQTALAEASIAAALEIVKDELALKYTTKVGDLPLVILALGKLGGRGLDYDSDLDLVIVYDDASPVPEGVTHAEFYSRAVEILVTIISAMTRDGNLYRVDLRLRPYGSKGLTAISSDAFLRYMRETAAIWELLAFVRLRAVGGDIALAEAVEKETRTIIHNRAAKTESAELAAETVRVRHSLEQQRARARRSKEIDIKYGSGGMLDVYFAMRFLQLRDNVPDDSEDRSTPFMLRHLAAAGSLEGEMLKDLLAGYEFLSTLDHNLRLTVGRTNRIPLANEIALKTIAARMDLESPSDLLEQLTLHRLNIREAFDNIVQKPAP
ncbi:MAG: hypothetical protein IPL32_13785 [Chloracidobacterium sp.]|nr:hypothetical protein [Chloracidobacterium sp.]